jgi:GTPase involved in cell partitioning and DNA repair
MGASTFSGPLKAGTVREGASANVGSAVMTQTIEIARDATLVQNGTIYLPQNAEILSIHSVPQVLYDSATSATLSIGTASGGTQYGGSLDMKTVGRKEPAYTAAQGLAMRDIGTNTTLVATVTSVGQPTVGKVTVVVQYRQR